MRPTRWRLVRRGAAYLRRRAIPEALLEAELLLRHLLGCDRAAFLAAPEAAVPRPLAARYLRRVRARGRGVPAAYLTGEKEFFGLPFRVSPAVLVPRPETEGLVEAALASLPPEAEGWALDVGTGSGCVAVALAVARPRLRVLATDVSRPALAVARENARRHRVADRVHFLQTDLTAGARPGRFRLLVANPPYVAPAEAATLPREVREHEPAVALFSPAGGTALHRRLAERVPELLRPGGAVFLEVAPEQADTVARWLRAVGVAAAIRRDLAGRPRIVGGPRQKGATSRRPARP